MFDCSKCIKIGYELYVFFTGLLYVFDERKVNSLLISFVCFTTQSRCFTILQLNG